MITHISKWDLFMLWIEDDATQLGISVVTYYFLCSLVGAIQGIAISNVMLRLL